MKYDREAVHGKIKDRIREIVAKGESCTIDMVSRDVAAYWFEWAVNEFDASYVPSRKTMRIGGQTISFTGAPCYRIDPLTVCADDQ